jgi:co-chaperonin GroES (HSP10)
MMKIKPLPGKVLLRTFEPATEKSMIIIPDEAKKKQGSFGQVLEIGDEVTLVEVGDSVVFNEYSFDTFELEKQKYFIGPEDGVVAKLTE